MLDFSEFGLQAIIENFLMVYSISRPSPFLYLYLILVGVVLDLLVAASVATQTGKAWITRHFMCVE